jgi:hypothetical protein
MHRKVTEFRTITVDICNEPKARQRALEIARGARKPLEGEEDSGWGEPEYINSRIYAVEER